jgi:1,4-dihydroxy-2-naphthoyl-CoA hydrolase
MEARASSISTATRSRLSTAAQKPRRFAPLPRKLGEMENLAEVAPLAGTLGIELIQATPEEVRGGMEWAPEKCTAAGVLHGGAIMAFADTLGGVCAFLNLPDGATTTATVESKTNFFRAVREGSVEAVTRPLHVGRSFIVVQTDVRDSEQRHVAQTTQTQAVLS